MLLKETGLVRLKLKIVETFDTKWYLSSIRQALKSNESNKQY